MLLEPQQIAMPEFGLATGGAGGLGSDQTRGKGLRNPDFPGSAHNRWSGAELSNIDLPSHWSVPWSDLMMVMMVMFAVMYAAKLPERDASVLHKKNAPVSALLPPELAKATVRESDKAPISSEEIFRLSEKLVKEANLGNIDVVLTDNDAIKVSVHGNLFFDLGMADLKPEAISFLQQLSGIIAANNYKIEISGHTDDFPISSPVFPTNWELSSARAAKVARYLIDEGKLDPGRFTVIGHASYQPTLPNTTLSNKAKNRRVEIVITREEYKP